MKQIEDVLVKIKDLRQKKGLSHENMAFELGMSQAAYTNMEKNKTKITVERLIKIAEILNKPIYYFFDITPKKVYNQNLHESAVGYQQDIENLYQDNKDMADKLENSYKENIKILKEENAFLKELLHKKGL